MGNATKGVRQSKRDSNDEETMATAVVSVSPEWTPLPQDHLHHHLLLNVTLACTAEGTREERRLTFDPYPSTVDALKRQLQDQLSIPACVQRLTFGPAHLEDDRTLEHYAIREEDHLCLEYPTSADTQAIADVVEEMERTAAYLDSIQGQLTSTPVPLEVRREIADRVSCTSLEKLSSDLLLSTYPKSGTNRLLFVRSGGLALVRRLHSLVLRQRWDKVCSVRLQQLECVLLRVVWNVTACFGLRRELLRYPLGLEDTVASFFRVLIPLRGSVRAPPNVYMTTVDLPQQDEVLCQVLFNALGALCNLMELPECQLQIASNHEVLDQLMAMLLTPSYTPIASEITLGGLLCLAYNPHTHPHLLTPKLFACVLEACSGQQGTHLHQDEDDLLLIRYFATLFLAHVAIAANPPALVPDLPGVLSFMEGFLTTASYENVHSVEQKYGFVWSTVLPSFRLAYHPPPSNGAWRGRREPPNNDGKVRSKGDPTCMEEEGEQRRLWLLCVEAGVFSLQNMLLGPAVRRTMEEEGLSGYLACLPWSLPKGTRAHVRAEELMAAQNATITTTGRPPQGDDGVGTTAKRWGAPPPLEVMARAKVAVCYVGLEKAMKRSAQELVGEICPMGVR